MVNIVIQDIYISKQCLNKQILKESQYNLFYLQKKIYQASKECHWSLVQSLQKLLVSLSSVKALAQIKAKQVNLNSKVINLNVIKYNFIKSSSNLTLQVKKQIILWCLKPEWQPKIVSSRISEELTKAKFEENYIHNICSFEVQVSLQCIKIKYILAKLQTINWIAEAIQNCLKTKFFIQYVDSKLNRYFRYDELYHLIKLVLFNGINWNLLRQNMSSIETSIENITFFQCLKKSTYIYRTKSLKLAANKILVYLMSDLNFTHQYFRCHNLWNIKKIGLVDLAVIGNEPILQNHLYSRQYNELFQNLRHLLFHKDRFGRSRINTSLSLSTVAKQLNGLIYKQQTSHSLEIEEYAQWQVNKHIRKILYRWSKKSCK